MDGIDMSGTSGRRSVRRAVVIGALTALLSGCISAPPKASSTRIGGPTTSAASTTLDTTPAPSTTSRAHPTTTTTPPTTQPPLDPTAVATTVSLAQSDVPSDATPHDGPSMGSHKSDPCLPASSSPFLANRLSTSFVASNGAKYLSYRSQVLVEPSTQAATDVVNALNSPQWAQNCDKPQQIDAQQQDLDATNAATDCGLTLVAPEETEIPAAKLPAGTTGWQFSATVHCHAHNSDWATGVDTLVTRVGRVVIIYMVAYSTVVPGQSDLQIISALAARAHSALRV